MVASDKASRALSLFCSSHLLKCWPPPRHSLGLRILLCLVRPEHNFTTFLRRKIIPLLVQKEGKFTKPNLILKLLQKNINLPQRQLSSCNPVHENTIDFTLPT